MYKLQEAVPPRFRRNPCTFLSSIAIANRIRQFDTSGGGGLWAQLAAGTPGTLAGDAWRETSDMDGTATFRLMTALPAHRHTDPHEEPFAIERRKASRIF